MTALAQIGHVFMKDVREHKLLLALYLALVVIATGHALDWRPFTGAVFGGTMMLVGLAGILLVASAVQGDSPTRSDAFWVSHPIEPLSVLSAKVVFALVVVAAAVAGQAIAVASYHPAGGDTARLLVRPSISFATVVLAAMVAASLTRDLRTFALATIAVPVTMIVSFAVLSAYAASTFAVAMDSRAIAPAKWLALAVAATIIVWLYRTRDPRWRTRIVGYLAAGVAVLTTVMAGMDLPGRPRQVSVPRIPLALEAASPSLSANTDRLVMALVVPDLPDGYLFAIRAPVATVRFADGSTARVLLGYGYVELPNASFSPTPVIPGIRWVSLAPRPSRRTITLAGELSPAQSAAIAARGAAITVDANVDVDTLRAAVSMPLAAGAEMRRDGRRTRIERWSHASGVPEIAIHSASVGDDPSFSPSLGGGFPNGVEYALINRSRGEAISLGRTETGMQLDGLVLPGSTISLVTIRFDGRMIRNAGRDLPGEDWYRDADLVSITRRALGSYPLTLRLDIPPR